MSLQSMAILLVRPRWVSEVPLYISISWRELSSHLHRTEWAEVIPSVRYDREDQQDSPREVLDVEDSRQPPSLEINEVLLV